MRAACGAAVARAVPGCFSLGGQKTATSPQEPLHNRAVTSEGGAPVRGAIARLILPLLSSTLSPFPTRPARPSKRSRRLSQRGLARSLLTPAPRPCSPCERWCSSTGSSSATTTAPGSACSGDSRRRSRTRSCPARRARWTAAAPKAGEAPKGTPYLRSYNSTSSSHQTSRGPTAEDPGRCIRRYNQSGTARWCSSLARLALARLALAQAWCWARAASLGTPCPHAGSSRPSSARPNWWRLPLHN